jgi:hypothetical protein
LAAKLRADSINIPVYPALEKMKLLPERNTILAAYQQLIGLSNRLVTNRSATFTSDYAMLNDQSAKSIRQLLRIPG